MSQAPGTINRLRILLDNQSTCNVFVNAQFLQSIRPAPNNTEMHIHCDAGTIICQTVGDLSGFGTVWYHSKGIANVLSLGKVKDIYRVTYNSKHENTFEVVTLGDALR